MRVLFKLYRILVYVGSSFYSGRTFQIAYKKIDFSIEKYFPVEI